MIDTTEWKRRGYVPAASAARALGLARISLHRHMDRGEIPFEREGRYRFIKVDDLVGWVRGQYTDRELAAEKVRAVRAAARIREAS